MGSKASCEKINRFERALVKARDPLKRLLQSFNGLFEKYLRMFGYKSYFLVFLMIPMGFLQVSCQFLFGNPPTDRCAKGLLRSYRFPFAENRQWTRREPPGSLDALSYCLGWAFLWEPSYGFLGLIQMVKVCYLIFKGMLAGAGASTSYFKSIVS